MPWTIPELDAFLAEWTDTPEKNRIAFIELKNQLDAKPGVVLSFVARPLLLRRYGAGPG